jgi:hypothetical protein
MPQPLVILGTYLLAEEVFDLISDIPGVEVAAFIENFDRSRAGQELEGRPIVWIDDAAAYAKDHLAICALSTTQRRTYSSKPPLSASSSPRWSIPPRAFLRVPAWARASLSAPWPPSPRAPPWAAASSLIAGR